MDRIQAMQVFLRVVETNSFSKAAETLSMAPSSVTSIIKSLENHLQVRLLHRTTRSLSLTPEGERYYQRSRDILQAIDDTESDLQHRTSRPKGRLRIDMPGTVARALVLPRLQEFFALYPDIQLMLGMNDRPMDLVHEGMDCVLRTGELRDSSLVARRLCSFQWITCGAPAYFEEQGVPQSIADLRRHQAVQYFSGSTGRTSEFHFLQDGKEIAVPMAGQLAVNDTDSYIHCCLHGYGLIQLAAYLVREELASGKLREVLAEGRRVPVPVSFVYPHNRHLSPAVRVFSDWMVGICADLA